MNGDIQYANETHNGSKYFINMWKDNKFFTDDYIKLINSHWLQFMPPNSNLYYVYGIFHAIVMILGCIGNFLAIFIILKYKSLQRSVNVLMLNLAITDFILLAKMIVVMYNSYYLGPALGNLGCQIDGFIGSLTGIVSSFTLTAISFVRYNGVVHPLKSLANNYKNKTRIWIGVIWMYGFLFSVIPLVNLDYGFAPEGFLINCNFDYLSVNEEDKWFIMIFYIICVWLLPSVVVFYCYIKMLIAVYGYSEASDSRIGQESVKKRTDVIFGIMVTSAIMLYSLSWTPIAVVAMFGMFEKKEFISPQTTIMISLSNKLCSCVNPWVYIILPKCLRTRV